VAETTNDLIRRYEHNHFRGWVVATKRRGRRWVRYFSDKPRGRLAALRAARALRKQLLATLPPPRKVKTRYVLNTTGVIGVALVKERTRAGRPFLRYTASWPRPDGRTGRATFSVAKHGRVRARQLAILARTQGLADLGL
jgi:hypothetical protein